MSAASTAVIHAGPIEIRFLVDADDSGGSVTVFECRVPPGVQTPAPHSHDAFEETMYGLEGVSTWTIDGQPREIGPGQAVCIPRGSIHGFANNGSSAATFLAVATPGLFGPAYLTPASTKNSMP